MTVRRFTIAPGAGVFKTSLGWCGMEWTARGVSRFVLPMETKDEVLEELGTAGALPPAVRAIADRVKAHLRGRPDPMTDIPLDLQGSAFSRRVWRALRKVQPGGLTSYGELAAKVGSPGAARAVGSAMATNPLPLLVPCHRVLPKDGSLGAYSGPGGPAQKAQLLFREGVILDAVHAAGIKGLRGADPKLRRIIDRVGPYLPGYYSDRDPWETLCQSIIHQQLSLKAAYTIEMRVRALTAGEGLPKPDEIPKLTDDTLRGAGLSFAKAGFLRDLAAHVTDGRLRPDALRRLDDEAVIENLTAVKGIGEWSAHMFLIFYLGRLDVLPVGDVGLRNAAGVVYGLDPAPKAGEFAEMGEKWRPWRSMASWYLWQSQE